MKGKTESMRHGSVCTLLLLWLMPSVMVLLHFCSSAQLGNGGVHF